MFKKIQQYLLLNHPLLWNMRVVPAVLGAVVINILFFLTGYLLTTIDFSDRYSYSNIAESGFVWMGTILTGIILFIIWLVFYSKNNAFKSFYPKSSGSLYLEWVLSFVIICGFVLFPVSFYQGSESKVRSYASKQEMINAIETLNLVKILLPEDKRDYYLEYPTAVPSVQLYMKDHPSQDLESSDQTTAVADSEYIDPVEYAESHNVHFDDYPDFAQLSLLNYNSRKEFYISSRSDFTIRGNDTVKQWLRDQNKEEISKLMDAFIALQNKHNLKSNLTKDQWMKLVYNPSKYPVGDFNLITSYNYKDNLRKNSYSYKIFNKNVSNYYVSYDELERSYDRIMDAYVDRDHSLAFYTVAIIFSLALSLLVFSFRSTTGKSWLIALISMGLILFINGIFSFAISSSFDEEIVGVLFYIFILLMLFSIELVSVLRKNANRQAKGRSDIYINHLVWFVPAVPALLFMALYIIANDAHSDSRLYDVYKFMDKHIVEFIWGNVVLTFLSMWFFIQAILRKWKSLPEQ